MTLRYTTANQTIELKRKQRMQTGPDHKQTLTAMNQTRRNAAVWRTLCIITILLQR